jgi:hypothetical protein
VHFSNILKENDMKFNIYNIHRTQGFKKKLIYYIQRYNHHHHFILWLHNLNVWGTPGKNFENKETTHRIIKRRLVELKLYKTFPRLSSWSALYTFLEYSFDRFLLNVYFWTQFSWCFQTWIFFWQSKIKFLFRLIWI